MRYVLLPVVVAALLVPAVASCTEPREPIGAVPSERGGLQGMMGSQQPPSGQGHVEDPDSPVSVDAQGRLRLGGLAWYSPEGWTPRSPETPFADWEYVLPGDEEGADALLTMGSIGGTVEQNILRWQAQLGESLRDKRQRPLENLHDVPVTYYQAVGTLRGEANMMTVALLFDYQETPQASPLVYVRVNGPKETVREHLERIVRFGMTAVPVPHLEAAEEQDKE